uniref:Homer protein n=1 Tax=Fagus sylvatica TaxID=28930 RepID=A0A2N9GXL5_FAGSY
MVELQSCASLVSASALCAIEQEVKGEGVNVISEITAELQRERRKNAELMDRISVLEAQIHERNKDSLPADGQGSCPNAMERSFKKLRRQRIETTNVGTENGNINKIEMSLQKMHDSQCLPPKDTNLEDRLVNWMSMDDNQFLHIEKFKDGDLTADFDDTDDSDDEYDDYHDEDDINSDHKVRVADASSKTVNELKEYLLEGVDVDDGSRMPHLESCSGGQSEPTFSVVNQLTNENRKENVMVPDKNPVYDEKELKKLDRKETKKVGEDKAVPEILTFDKEVCHTAPGSQSLHKKSPKVAFCPKEVKRIIESEILLQKNAQSHTIRKIIVFASLGIRHGCEDMYELDFNHFSILRKGEPYVSPKEPGNLTLCPVQILEEEKAMRPSDASCPSCLFLCIKYGGRTRNLPQNEYVRQRMGRNKLKSFGPLMCRIAMLVHIRSGSFFFKALGITLLFMAGFPDDLVQRETKYQNLDLLQKYYRTDEDAEGEELFLPHPVTSDTQASPGSQQLTGKTISTKSRGRKQTSSNSKSNNLQRSSVQQYTPSSSANPAHFGLMGYTSFHSHAMAAFQSMPSQTSTDATLISNPVVPGTATNVSYHNQAPFHVFPQQPANAFLPMMYWPPPNTFPPRPYPSTYGFQSFPSTSNYMSIHQQPYYSHSSSNPYIPKTVEGIQKNGMTLEEADSDSDSSSSSTDAKEH